jgi:hypothetical protein
MIAIFRETFIVEGCPSVLRRVATFATNYMDILSEGRYDATLTEAIGTTSFYSTPTLSNDQMTDALRTVDNWSGADHHKRLEYMLANWPEIHHCLKHDGEWRKSFDGCHVRIHLLEE